MIENFGWGMMVPFVLTSIFGLIMDTLVWRHKTPDLFMMTFGVACCELVFGLILVVASHLAWVTP